MDVVQILMRHLCLARGVTHTVLRFNKTSVHELNDSDCHYCSTSGLPTYLQFYGYYQVQLVVNAFTCCKLVVVTFITRLVLSYDSDFVLIDTHNMYVHGAMLIGESDISLNRRQSLQTISLISLIGQHSIHSRDLSIRVYRVPGTTLGSKTISVLRCIFPLRGPALYQRPCRLGTGTVLSVSFEFSLVSK